MPAVKQSARASGASGVSEDASPIEVRPVRTRRERERFVRLPWTIYANDPHWAPPLLLDVKQFIDPRKHAFYRHGAAQPLLAWRDGQPVGRMMVSDDPRYHATHADNVGCFGMFESVDDPAVAHALLDSAAQWLTARGRTSIRGPIDYSLSYPAGLLIEGFDTPPRVMMNHHPPYYAALLESWGLAKAKDLYAWWFDDSNQMLDKWRRREERFRAKSGITIRPFSKRHFDADVQACMNIYRDAWEKNWGFVPMSDAECRQFAGHLRTLAVPELILLAEHQGKTVGMALTLPDFNEALRPLNGRLTTWGLPIGLLRFLYRIKRLKTARLVALGVHEAYRRRGVCESLILHTLETGKHRFHLTGAELSWTLEDNDAINNAIRAVGGRHYKTYRVYQREI
jgi:hypothetical protein